MYSKMWQFIAR